MSRLKRPIMIPFIHLLGGALLLLTTGSVCGYPIDAFQETGIGRLEGYRLANEGKIAGNRLPSGALLSTDKIQLRLIDQPDFALPASDKAFTRQIVDLLGDAAKQTSVCVLDLSNPANPVYAEHNALAQRNPGSVGKIMLVMALFQALADLYPDDIEAREHLLLTTQVTADRFIRYDRHPVPIWYPELNRIVRRPLREGDTGNLWSYLDWTLSASSNAAASTVMKQLMLLRYFGKAYPVSSEMEKSLFLNTPYKARSALLLDSLLLPLARNELDSEQLRQGAFFTREGKRQVGGTTSTSTVRELIRMMVRMEEGKLVDTWSSLELKRLLYITQTRIRYAASPALRDAALYFKSGSLYKCDKMKAPDCRKYEGNVYNLMNSVAIIESPAGEAEPPLYYLVALTSNVLGTNSAVAHQTFATRLHRLIKARQSEPAIQ